MDYRSLGWLALCVQVPALIALALLGSPSWVEFAIVAGAGTAIALWLAEAVRREHHGAVLAEEESDLLYQALAELSGGGMWVTDAEGITTSADPKLRKMLGYRANEMEGRPQSDFIADEDEEDPSEYPIGVDGEQEVELLRRNGKRISVRAASALLDGGGGEALGALTLVTEADSRKQAEAETELLKNDFFALVSHELRTPLTSMDGYLGLMTETQAKRMTKQGRDFLEVIHRNTVRLSTLLADLMLMTQVEAGTFTMECDQVNLTAVARRSVEEAAPAAQKAGIELKILPAEQVACWGDDTRLGQVLDNLILNAIKFTPTGGHVKVRIGENGSNAVIEVIDDGPGMPAAEHKEMFNRFYQGSDARARQVQGLGLGLAITKAIVDAHGGKLDLVTETGAGSTFTAQLPRHRPQPGSPRWVRTSGARKSRRLGSLA
jgi:PAS domain S-box-containing protein